MKKQINSLCKYNLYNEIIQILKIYINNKNNLKKYN